jgi:putative nucleotidyltransferase with HDIG domain
MTALPNAGRANTAKTEASPIRPRQNDFFGLAGKIQNNVKIVNTNAINCDFKFANVRILLKKMDREKALQLLSNNLKTENLLKHCLASEAIMRSLAKELNKDIEKWGIAGLLHDLDFEKTKDDPANHTLVSAGILEGHGIDDEIIKAIKGHNAEALGINRESKLDFALAAAETVTGLIIATALVYPDKKLKSVKTKSVLKRMKERAFAKNVNREIIKECENLGIALEKFIEISIGAMQEISDDLGL